MMSKTATSSVQVIRPTTIESVKFRDGEMVDAEALTAAMEYPASMLQTVLRSYLGCGVVCGLEMKVSEKPTDGPIYTVCVNPGVMIDCHGYPAELCNAVELDLSPDPCNREDKEFCIVMRRITSEEIPPDPCGRDADARHQCSRVRDHVLIRAVPMEELAESRESVCQRPEPAKPDSGEKDKTEREVVKKDLAAPTGRIDTLCDCLTTCCDANCTTVSWVLLGKVAVNVPSEPIRSESDRGGAQIDLTRRKYVKPIECHCGPGMVDLQERLERLEQKAEGKAAAPSEQEVAVEEVVRFAQATVDTAVVRKATAKKAPAKKAAAKKSAAKKATAKKSTAPKN